LGCSRLQTTEGQAQTLAYAHLDFSGVWFVLAHLDELGPTLQIGLQPAERYYRHSELEPQAIEEPVVDGVKGRRQVETDQDSDLLVVGRREDPIQDLQ